MSPRTHWTLGAGGVGEGDGGAVLGAEAGEESGVGEVTSVGAEVATAELAPLGEAWPAGCPCAWPQAARRTTASAASNLMPLITGANCDR
jgi:hypothetical protein